MGSSIIMCPMCCNETFNNLQSLKDHLLSMTNNLYCPGCSQRYFSMDDFVQHLDKCTEDNCEKNDDNIQIQMNCHNYKGDQTEILMDTNVEEINFLNQVNEQQLLITDARTLEVDENGDIKVVEPLEVSEKQLKLGMEEEIQETDKESPVISIPEVLNSQESTENVLTMLPEDSAEFLDSDQNLMEIEHEDGELNDAEFLKVKQELCEVKSEEEEEIDSSTVYNCSSCGVSFNSVIDHIKEYHEGQDVILEVNGESATEETEAQPLKVEEKPARGQRQKMNILRSEPTVDSEGRAFVRNVVQIDDFWDKNTKPANSKMIEKFFANPEVPDNAKLARKNEMPQRMYKCKQCLEQFSKLGDFRNHACCNGSNQCDLCDQAFATVKALQMHMKVHGACLSPTKKNFICRICGTQFASHKSLRLHSRMHAPVKAREVEAPVGKPATTFECQECGKTLSESYRDAHMSLHAGDTATCGVCNRKFDSVESLAMHVAVHPELGVQVPLNQSEANEQQSPVEADDDQDQTKPYKCQHCGRRFTRPHEKVKHERIHTGEKPHVCEVCGKKFRVSYCLTLHMRTHTGQRPYQCKHCNKRFKASSVYNHHLLTHGEERAYTCPYCPKNFKTRVQLAGHKNSHTKPFRCTECSRPFASLYAARAHIATHKKDNNLKFTCHICGASYGRAFALKDHLKSHKEEADDPLPPESAPEEEINQHFLLEEEEILEEILES